MVHTTSSGGSVVSTVNTRFAPGWLQVRSLTLSRSACVFVTALYTRKVFRHQRRVRVVYLASTSVSPTLYHASAWDSYRVLGCVAVYYCVTLIPLLYRQRPSICSVARLSLIICSCHVALFTHPSSSLTRSGTCLVQTSSHQPVVRALNIIT